MTENEFELLEEEKPKKLQFGWLIPIFLKPKETLNAIAEKKHGVWLTPILILMLTALILVMVSAPIITQAAQGYTLSPEDMQYYSEEEQAQMQQAMSMTSSPVITTVFPALGKFAGVWINWLLLGVILHLSLTLNGSRSSNRSALNLVAWSMMPFALRDIVQIVYILISKELINKPGLSGFIADGAIGFTAFISGVLLFIDIYLIWQILLLVTGVRSISGLSKGKAWMAALIAILVFIALKALPTLIGAQLAGLSGAMF